MDELKPCPFCGGDAELDTRQGYSQFPNGQRGSRIAAYCRDCGADIGICREDVPSIEPEQVVELWNRRVTDGVSAPGQHTPGADPSGSAG